MGGFSFVGGAINLPFQFSNLKSQFVVLQVPSPLIPCPGNNQHQ